MFDKIAALDQPFYGAWMARHPRYRGCNTGQLMHAQHARPSQGPARPRWTPVRALTPHAPSAPCSAVAPPRWPAQRSRGASSRPEAQRTEGGEGGGGRRA